MRGVASKQVHRHPASPLLPARHSSTNRHSATATPPRETLKHQPPLRGPARSTDATFKHQPPLRGPARGTDATCPYETVLSTLTSFVFQEQFESFGSKENMMMQLFVMVSCFDVRPPTGEKRTTRANETAFSTITSSLSVSPRASCAMTSAQKRRTTQARFNMFPGG